MLKADWEKTGETVTLPDTLIHEMGVQALGRPLESFQIISGGCANLNIRAVAKGASPVILRVYVRDKAAAGRERAISKLLSDKIPVPKFLYSGEFGGYRFAAVECAEGVTLRDVLLKTPQDAGCAVHDAGRIAASLQKYIFSEEGGFDENLKVTPHDHATDYAGFGLECLAHPFVQMQFGKDKVKRLEKLLKERKADFPDDIFPCLVHGDYDPANILVKPDGAGWTVSAILDWEFAFSGSWLWDASNMLRYAHLLPPAYEGAFLEGLKDGGTVMPENWRVTLRLMNLLSLMDCLVRAKDGNRPKTCADICKLTDWILEWFGSQGYACGATGG